MTIIEIAQILLLLSATALCVALIYYLGIITKTIKEIQSELNKIANETGPLLESLQTLSQTILSISNDVRYQLGKVSWVFNEVKSKVEAVVAFEDRIKGMFDNPSISILKNAGALRKGIASFWQSLKR